MNAAEVKTALNNPFARKDIEFRVCRASQKTKKVSVLAYITARAIMDRLDSVFGIEGWKDEYTTLDNGVKCRLSVNIGGTWISKEDVAAFTNIEALKGAFSDSLKRAGVKFGIGRYLYELPEHWVEVSPEKPRDANFPVHYHNSDGLTGYWVEPQLPQWALPDLKKQIPAEYTNKLDDLLARNILTSSKHSQYQQALAHPQITEIQQAVIWEQLALLESWSRNVYPHKEMSQDAKREIYLKIIGSNSKTIDAIRTEILSYEKQGEAA